MPRLSPAGRLFSLVISLIAIAEIYFCWKLTDYAAEIWLPDFWRSGWGWNVAHVIVTFLSFQIVHMLVSIVLGSLAGQSKGGMWWLNRD